jgi:hypothetical protein
MFEFRLSRHYEDVVMLNVIALHPAAKAQPKNEALKPPGKASQHHVLKGLMEENSGRLQCGDESELDIPPLEIYTAR